MKKRFAVVVLAGGEGSRMGGGKPLRHLGDHTLLEHALQCATDWSKFVAVSVRNISQVGDLRRVPVLLDKMDGGPIAGIGAALRFSRELGLDGVLTIPCDTPLLPYDLLDRLSDALNTTVGASVPVSGGETHWSCTLWTGDAGEQLARYLAGGQSSLKGFASWVGWREVEWPTHPFDPFLNINSRKDLAAAEWLIKSR